MLIGCDTMFPESGRILALLGCDVILCPSLMDISFIQGHMGTNVKQNYPIPTSADPFHWHLYRVRAGENNVYLAFSNGYDPKHGFYGKSGLFGPDTFYFPRNESIVTEDEGIGVMSISTENLDSHYPTNVIRRKDLVLMRQPHYYKDIISQTIKKCELLERI